MYHFAIYFSEEVHTHFGLLLILATLKELIQPISSVVKIYVHIIKYDVFKMVEII